METNVIVTTSQKVSTVDYGLFVLPPFFVIITVIITVVVVVRVIKFSQLM